MGDAVEQSAQQPVAAGVGARSGGDPDLRVDDPDPPLADDGEERAVAVTAQDRQFASGLQRISRCAPVAARVAIRAAAA